MNIKIGKIAYYFPTLRTLKSFIRSHAKDIMCQKEMIDIYKKYNDIGFDFYRTIKGLDWSFDYIKNYRNNGYTIIKCAQRTE